MSPFDILAVVILCFCLIRGFFRGIIKELSSIIGVLAGAYAAYTYYPYVAKYLSRWISSSNYQNLLSFVLLFCTVFIVVSILGVVIKYLMNIAFLGWVDRLFGTVFGFCKGVLIVAVLLFAFTTFLPKGTPLLKQSLVAPYITIVTDTMSRVVSKDIRDQFEIKLKELKKAWKI